MLSGGYLFPSNTTAAQFVDNGGKVNLALPWDLSSSWLTARF